MELRKDDVMCVLVNKQDPVIIKAFKKVLEPNCWFKKFNIEDDGDFWKVTPR